jgi:hypothetical protein
VENEEFRTVLSDAVRRRETTAHPPAAGVTTTGLGVNGWLIEQYNSYRPGENPAPGQWVDDWLDADYVLGDDAKIYDYRLWRDEDDHTPVDTGHRLSELNAALRVGNGGEPFNGFGQKIRRPAGRGTTVT